MESNKTILHTEEELQKIATSDLKKFKEICKYYLENNIEYFTQYCLPLLRSQEENQTLPEKDIPEKFCNEYSKEELEIIAKDNYERLMLIAKHAYEKDKEYYVKNFRPLINRYSPKTADKAGKDTVDPGKSVVWPTHTQSATYNVSIGKVLTFVGVVVLCIIMVSIIISLSNPSNYEEGMEFLKNENYGKALEKFNLIQSDDKNYTNAKSKIC